MNASIGGSRMRFNQLFLLWAPLRARLALSVCLLNALAALHFLRVLLSSMDSDANAGAYSGDGVEHRARLVLLQLSGDESQRKHC